MARRIVVPNLAAAVQHGMTAAERVLMQRGMLTALALRTAALEVLTGPRHGRVYRISGTRRLRYTASAPEEAPAERTGRLRRGWHPYTRVERTSSGSRVLAGISTNLRYARLLETGTSRMAARPYVQLIKARALGKRA